MANDSNTLRIPPKASDRRDDELMNVFREMHSVLLGYYERSGDLQVKPLVDRAHAVLGRIPR